MNSIRMEIDRVNQLRNAALDPLQLVPPKKEPRRGARIIIPTGRWQDKRRRRDTTMKTRMRENEHSQLCMNITT